MFWARLVLAGGLVCGVGKVGGWLAARRSATPKLVLHEALPVITMATNALMWNDVVHSEHFGEDAAALVALLMAVYTASSRAIYRPAIAGGICLGVYMSLLRSPNALGFIVPLATLQRHQKLERRDFAFQKITGRDLFGVGVLSAIIGIAAVTTHLGYLYYTYCTREYNAGASFADHLRLYIYRTVYLDENQPGYNLTWYLGVVMFPQARLLHGVFLKFCIVFQSIPMSLLWIRQPHSLMWVLMGVVPLLESRVNGVALVYSVSVILMYGGILVQNKLALYSVSENPLTFVLQLIVAHCAAWVFKYVDILWRDYYSSNAYIALLAGAGANLGISLVWVWLYTRIHALTFLTPAGASSS